MGVILWLSDLHLDPYYGSDAAASHKAGTNCSLPANATLLEHPYGRVGCDTPIQLLDFAMANAANNNGKIDLVLITGDFSRHSMENLSGSVYDNVEFVLTACIQAIQTALPNVPILPVLGNNDVVPDYYLGEQFDSADDEKDDHQGKDAQEDMPHNTAADNNMPDPKTMLDSVAYGLKDAFLNHDELFFFSQGGYFSRRVPLDSQKSILVLSLNTVLYSTRHEPYIQGHDPDPYGQFEWMKSQLQMVANSNANSNANSTANTTTTTSSSSSRIVGVYLAGHIPPSVGSYRHSQLWRDEYLQEFSTILQDYSNGKYNTVASESPPPPILGHFYGHVHTEEFRLLRYKSHQTQQQMDSATIHNVTQGTNNNHTITKANDPLVVPVLVTSSITPIYGSNPSYRLVEYNEKTGALVDYKTHYLDLDRTAANVNAGNEKNATSHAGNSKTNANLWIELSSFAQAYNVPDLSLDSFQSLFESLEGEMMNAIRAELCGSGDDDEKSSTVYPLWETFWRRQNLYSTTPDDGDDDNNSKNQTTVMVDWLCTFGASSAQDYKDCLEAKQSELTPEKLCGNGGGTMESGISSNGSSSNPPLGDKDGGNPPSKPSLSLGGKGAPFVAVTTAVAIFGIVLLAVAVRNCTRRVSKRKLYSVPQQDHNDNDDGHEEEGEEGDGVFAVDDGLPAEPDIEIT